MNKYLCVALLSGVLSAFSQILLKKSSTIKRNSVVKEYINPFVITGYALTLICMAMMIFAYKGLEYKTGAILESLIYFYVMILGKLFFNEKLTLKRIAGNLLIVGGVAVFSM